MWHRPRDVLQVTPHTDECRLPVGTHHAWPSRPLKYSHRRTGASYMYRGAHTRAESAPDGAAALVAPRFLDMGFDCSVIVFDRTEVPTLRPVHTVGW